MCFGVWVFGCVCLGVCVCVWGFWCFKRTDKMHCVSPVRKIITSYGGNARNHRQMKWKKTANDDVDGNGDGVGRSQMHPEMPLRWWKWTVLK